MKKIKITLLVCFALLVTFVVGLFWVPDLDAVSKQIAQQIPGAHLDKQFAISLGPASFGFVGAVARIIPGTKVARSFLSEIRGVKIAVYEIENMPDDFVLDTPSKLQGLLEEDDWELAVRCRDGGESVWILYRSKGDAVTDFFIVVAENDELVLVRIRGRMDRLIAKVMDEHMDLGQAELHEVFNDILHEGLYEDFHGSLHQDFHIDIH
jgi:hypothetical protein